MKIFILCWQNYLIKRKIIKINMYNVRLTNMNFVFVFFIIYLLSIIAFVLCGYGADDQAYEIYWNDTYPLQEYLFYDKEFEKRAIEIVYSYLFAFFKIFTNDIEVFKFFNTFIALSIMTYAYYKISKKYYLYMLIYTSIYLFIDFNIDQFRNALAASFGLLAIVQFSKKEKYYSFFNFLIAVLIHTSMMWMAIIYLIKNKNYNKIIITILIILVLLPNKVDLVIENLNNNFFNTINMSLLLTKVQYYTLASYTGQFKESFFSFFMGKTILIFILGYLVKVDKVYVYSYLYAILFFYFFIDFETFGARIVREVLLLEPIFLYFLLKNNLKYILLIPFLLIYNIFSKNLPLIDRMIN